MIERLPVPARQVFVLADEESDRLRHNYVGCEHVLAALVRHPSPAAETLAVHGLDLDVLRGGLGELVADGILPPAWRNHAALLDSLGVDLAAVRTSIEETFGTDMVERATRQATRRTGWSPLCGKAHVFKRALQLAHDHQSPSAIPASAHRPSCSAFSKTPWTGSTGHAAFDNPWNRRRRSTLGLPIGGPAPSDSFSNGQART
ncbi:Clp protease N-terminal domain-containing protein [Actinopolymorpha sp. B17G11]|uniref:Clp protease N-terminal domain-containing protein n=1 Tax=Actinopolymorpha sp. B17G11 TaxID=3160861 RepID=UPI0032E3B60E